MKQPTRRPAAMRAVLIVLLLTGFGLWQAWQCSDGAMASPIAGMPAMSAGPLHGDRPGDATTIASDSDSDSGMPAGLAGLCITVLVSVAAAFMLMASPLRLMALLRRTAALTLRPIEFPVPEPALAQLCISRT